MAQAFLTKIETKETKAGTMTDFTFSDGNKIGAGKFPPKFAKEGEYYSYEFSQNGNFKNLVAGSFKQLDKPAGVSAPTAPAAAPAKSWGKDPATQDTISRQAAANTALAFVKLLHDTDSLPVAKTAKAGKADLVEAILRDYMDKFHRWSTHKPFDFGDDDVISDLNLSDLEDKDQWTE